MTSWIATGPALARYAATWDEASLEHASHNEFGHIIAAVTVGDLRDRLLHRRLRAATLRDRLLHRLRSGEAAIELFVPLQPDCEEIF